MLSNEICGNGLHRVVLFLSEPAELMHRIAVGLPVVEFRRHGSRACESRAGVKSVDSRRDSHDELMPTFRGMY